MRHRYSCPLRWADMDALGHVNNVVFADYLQEARVDMLRIHARGPQTGALAEGVVVAAQRLQYVVPLTFGFDPVQVEVWVTEVRAASFTLAYEVFHERDGERTVYLRATTLLTPYVFAQERPRRLSAEEKEALAAYVEPLPADSPLVPAPVFGPVRRTELGHYPVQVRFSDVDVYGHVNNVQYFEFFQEGRILLLGRQLEQLGPGASMPAIVVAQQDIEYKAPILFRAEPYDSYAWVAQVGNRSMVLEAVITDGPDGAQVLARGRFVMVFFDTATGRSAEPAPELRELLTASVAPPQD